MGMSGVQGGAKGGGIMSVSAHLFCCWLAQAVAICSHPTCQSLATQQAAAYLYSIPCQACEAHAVSPLLLVFVQCLLLLKLLHTVKNDWLCMHDWWCCRLWKGLVPLWGRQIPYTMMKFGEVTEVSGLQNIWLFFHKAKRYCQ